MYREAKISIFIHFFMLIIALSVKTMHQENSDTNSKHTGQDIKIQISLVQEFYTQRCVGQSVMACASNLCTYTIEK